MDTRQMVTELEAEIALLQQVRSLLAGAGGANLPRVAGAAPATRRGGRRPLSIEARERIAAAQRARWAKSKRAAKRAAKKAAKSTAKSSAKAASRPAAKKTAKRAAKKAGRKPAVKSTGRRTAAKKAPAKRVARKAAKSPAPPAAVETGQSS